MYKACKVIVTACCFTLLSFSLSHAAPSEAKCHGDTTPISSNSHFGLAVCHGDYVKIDRSKFNNWQSCTDSMLLLTDKKLGKTFLLIDCLPTRTTEFKFLNDVLSVRHFSSSYPGYKEEPLLIESIDLHSLSKTYLMLRKLPACNKQDVDRAIKQIDTETAKPFDGNTYFAAVYGGFYKLRDCAVAFPTQVLTTLNNYSQKGGFDGEVSETLSDVIREATLIAAAKSSN